MNTQTLHDGLFFDGRLPLAFQPVRRFPDMDELILINEKNENILKTSVNLHESIEIEDHDEFSAEIRKLDHKLNLILDMLGELLIQKDDFPPKVSVRLTAKSLFFENHEFTNPLANHDSRMVRISLYVNPSIPSPLVLYGELKAGGSPARTTDLGYDTSNMLEVEFYGLSQAVKDQLEKMIFRYHRKSVAHKRASKDS